MVGLILRLFALHRWLLCRSKSPTAKATLVGVFALVNIIFFHLLPAFAQTSTTSSSTATTTTTTTSGSILSLDSILQFFAGIAFSVAAFITKWIVLLIDVLIPIMTYNNFVGNPVVRTGWAVVRDTVNMFFVIILIIIAFGTIFGAERFKWQQQVPRLLIMAIAVNFSKTLSGILIDFGQVIMLTFANALREIAAGNFIQLLGLNKIYAVSESSSYIESIKQQTGLTGEFDFFAAGAMSVLMTVLVLSTLIMLVAILVFRIVMLWVLVVIAPLAWFMKGAKGVIDSTAYEDWWKEFKCMVGIGPILAFFLWLTLAVAGTGNAALTAGFDIDSDSNAGDFISKFFETGNFMSFLIGMAMLFAGFKAATQFCNADIGGKFVGTALGMAKRGLPYTAAGLGLKGASLAGRVGIGSARLGGRGMKAAARYMPPTLANLPSTISRGVRYGVYGAGARVLPEKLGGAALKEKQIGLEQEKRVQAFAKSDQEKKNLERSSFDQLQHRIDLYLRKPPGSDIGQAQLTALFEKMMGDKRMQENLGPKIVEELWKSQGAKYRGMAQGNAARTANLEEFEKSHADFTGRANDLKKGSDLENLTDQAWQNKDVQASASRIMTTFKRKDGTAMTGLEAALAGHFGKDPQAAVVRGRDVSRLEMGAELEDHLRAALKSGDKQSVSDVVARVSATYTNPATSEPERQRLALSMDRMRAAMTRMQREGNTTTTEILPEFDRQRAQAEGKVGFGLPPAPQTGESPQTYFDKYYGQSNRQRVEAGVKDLETKETDTQKTVDDLQSELRALESADKATNAAVARKQRQIEEIRARIERGTRPEIDAASNDVRAARRLLTEARDRGDTEQIVVGENLLRETQAHLTNLQTEAKREVEGDDNDDIRALKKEIEDLVASSGGTRAKDVSEKSSKLAELKAHVRRLKETSKKLEQERDRLA